MEIASAMREHVKRDVWELICNELFQPSNEQSPGDARAEGKDPAAPNSPPEGGAIATDSVFSHPQQAFSGSDAAAVDWNDMSERFAEMVARLDRDVASLKLTRPVPEVLESMRAIHLRVVQRCIAYLHFYEGVLRCRTWMLRRRDIRKILDPSERDKSLSAEIEGPWIPLRARQVRGDNSLQFGKRSVDKLRIGIIGMGQMGQLLARYLHRFTDHSIEELRISTRRPQLWKQRVESTLLYRLDDQLLMYNNQRLGDSVDVVFLCCPPGELPKLAEQHDRLPMRSSSSSSSMDGEFVYAKRPMAPPTTTMIVSCALGYNSQRLRSLFQVDCAFSAALPWRCADCSAATLPADTECSPVYDAIDHRIDAAMVGEILESFLVMLTKGHRMNLRDAKSMIFQFILGATLDQSDVLAQLRPYISEETKLTSAAKWLTSEKRHTDEQKKQISFIFEEEERANNTPDKFEAVLQANRRETPEVSEEPEKEVQKSRLLNAGLVGSRLGREWTYFRMAVEKFCKEARIGGKRVHSLEECVHDLFVGLIQRVERIPDESSWP